MKIAKIRINNILGIDELEIAAGGAITEIKGKNGTGKTSILEAIKGALKGGHDATLLRKGAEKGEIVLVMDDAENTQIHKHVTADDSKTLMYRGDKKVTSPGGAIRALIDVMSMNPVEFLTALPKDRVKVLLESMPLKIDLKRLEDMSGVKMDASHAAMHALSLLSFVHRSVFDDRTGTNRALKEKDATINQLTLALPDVPGDGPSNEDELREHVAAATTKRDNELARIQTKWDGLQTESQAKIDAMRNEAQEAIDKIKAKLQTDLDAERTRIANIERMANQQRDKARTEHTTATEGLNNTLATIVANRNAFARREQSLETIRQMEEERAELAADHAKQEQRLKDIDAYKSELLATLPIPGLTVTDGEVERDGIPFDRLNTAQQVDIAIEIAKLRAGKLSVCCVDRFEALDPDTFNEFRKRAEESNLQLFVTRVNGEDFNIATA